MQRLIDPAVMIVAMIVPTLHSQGLEKRLHNSSPCCHRVSMLWRFDESDVTGASIGGERHFFRRTGRGRPRRARPASPRPPRPFPPAWGSGDPTNAPTPGI